MYIRYLNEFRYKYVVDRHTKFLWGFSSHNETEQTLFNQSKIKKHDMELQHYNAHEKNDGDNDESLDSCLNTEFMLRNLREVHFPTFNV